MPKGAQLPVGRDDGAVGQLGRNRGRLPGERRQRLRESVHRRRRGDQQPAERTVAAGHGVRVSAGSAGQDGRHPRPSTAARSAASSARSRSRAATCSPAKGTTTISGSGLSARPGAAPGHLADRRPHRVHGAGRRSSRITTNELGGSLGGPIVRDKLFFFGSHLTAVRERDTNEYLFSSGTDPGEIKREQTIMNAYGKVSYGSRRVNAYFGALLTPTTSEGTLPAYNGIGPQYLSTLQGGQRGEPRRVDTRSISGISPATSTSR